MPTGVDLAWASSNNSVATVDSSGNVTSIDAGNCVITASFDYEGNTYSDTCNVEVIQPEKVLGNFLLDDVWHNDSNWLSKNYEESSRQTYVYQYNNHLELCFNLDGETSTLFLDIRPVKEIFGEVDTSKYDYALRFNIKGMDFFTLSDTMTIEVKGTGASDNVFKLNTFSEVFEYGTVFDSTVELVPNNPDGIRLMTLQISISGSIPSDYVTLYINSLELVRVPKP